MRTILLVSLLCLLSISVGCAGWQARRECAARWDRLVARSGPHDPITEGLIREGERLAKAEFMEECLRGRR